VNIERLGIDRIRIFREKSGKKVGKWEKGGKKVEKRWKKMVDAILIGNLLKIFSSIGLFLVFV